MNNFLSLEPGGPNLSQHEELWPSSLKRAANCTTGWHMYICGCFLRSSWSLTGTPRQWCWVKRTELRAETRTRSSIAGYIKAELRHAEPQKQSCYWVNLSCIQVFGKAGKTSHYPEFVKKDHRRSFHSLMIKRTQFIISKTQPKIAFVRLYFPGHTPCTWSFRHSLVWQEQPLLSKTSQSSYSELTWTVFPDGRQEFALFRYDMNVVWGENHLEIAGLLCCGVIFSPPKDWL